MGLGRLKKKFFIFTQDNRIEYGCMSKNGEHTGALVFGLGITRNVQCFTVKWFDCAFGKGAQCSPRWIIKSSLLIYIFLLSIFLSGLMEWRFTGEIWLREIVWFDYLLRRVWLKSRTHSLRNYVAVPIAIEYFQFDVIERYNFRLPPHACNNICMTSDVQILLCKSRVISKFILHFLCFTSHNYIP